MADDSEQIGPDEIENLLNQARSPAPKPSMSQGSSSAPPNATGGLPQDEIDSLLNGMSNTPGARPKTATASATAKPPGGGGTATATRPGSSSFESKGSCGTSGASSTTAGDDIQLLLDQAEQAIASVDTPSPSPADAQAFQFRDLVGSAPSNEKSTIDLLRDVELDLKIELGRTHMELEELLKLRRGSVVSLDKLAGDPVDVYVNGRLIARGEVLVLNDNFCVRVAELISGDD